MGDVVGPVVQHFEDPPCDFCDGNVNDLTGPPWRACWVHYQAAKEELEGLKIPVIDLPYGAGDSDLDSKT